MPLPEIIAGLGTWLAAKWPGLTMALAILVAAWLLSRFLARYVAEHLPRNRRVDQTIVPFVSQIIRYGMLVIAGVIVLSQLGVDTTSILAVLGAIGLAVALALQGTLSNLAAGLMMIWLRPFNVGEYIDADGVTGTVVEIGLFSTRLRTYDGIAVFAPNARLWSAKVVNYSRLRTRMVETKIGIAYDADIAAAREALLGLATDPRVLPEPAPLVFVDTLGDSSVVLCLRSWVKTSDWWQVDVDFREQAKRRMDAAGIVIPYNKLDLYIARGTKSAK